MIVVGTSSIVYPAAGLPELALANGIPVIEVNPERTPLSDAATVSVRETAAGALPTLLQRLPAAPRLGDAASADRAADACTPPPASETMRAAPARDGRASTSKPAPTIDALGVAMGVAVAHQPRPHGGIGELLQPPADAAAGDMLEVPQLAAGPQQRKQLSQNGIRLIDRAQHQRAHDRVERASPVRPGTSRRCRWSP